MTQFLAKPTQIELEKKRNDIKEAFLAELDTEQREHYNTVEIVLGDLEGCSANQKRFLYGLAVTGVMPEACKVAGFSTGTVHEWLKDNTFREYYDLAKQIAVDYLEFEAFKLATGRVLKPIVSMGKVVTYERVYDTKLLHAILKAKKPNEYGNKVDITSGGRSLVKFIDRDTYDAV